MAFALIVHLSLVGAGGPFREEWDYDYWEGDYGPWDYYKLNRDYGRRRFDNWDRDYGRRGYGSGYFYNIFENCEIKQCGVRKMYVCYVIYIFFFSKKFALSAMQYFFHYIANKKLFVCYAKHEIYFSSS